MLNRPRVQNGLPLHRSLASYNRPTPRGASKRATYRGCDGAIEIDEAGRIVTKTYLHPDPNTAARNALREVDYASRLYDALAGLEGIACPRIIGWRLSSPPRVVMELCPGKELAKFLLGMNARDPRIADISVKIQAGLETYTRLFREPYYDCCFNNMLFDGNSGRLSFLDFVIPERWPPGEGGLENPLESSLGWLVGCACYALARPAFLFSSTAACLELLQSVLAGFGGRISRERVFALARVAFSRMHEPGGGVRRTYYETVGKLVTDKCLGRLQLGSLSGPSRGAAPEGA